MKNWLFTIFGILTAMSAQAALHGVNGGLVVQLCDADLSSHWDQPGLVFQCLDTSNVAVSGLRKEIQQLGLYGKVTADYFEDERLPYVDNLVNLIVAEGEVEIPMNELLRVLVPNGVAIINGKRIVKPRPPELDEWNHFLYDAASNPVSKDQVVGPPKRFQWIAGPNWSKHHEAYPPTIPLLVSANGRIFYFEEETPPCVSNVSTRWFLRARDAFNGVLLWEKEVPNWIPEAWPGKLGGGLGGGPADYKRRLIAVGDRIYVTLGKNAPVTELDAASGQTLRTFCDGSESVELLHQDGILFVITKENPKKSEQQISTYRLSDGKELCKAACGSGAIVLDGKVFSRIDGNVVALNVRTGVNLWTSPLIPPSSKANKKTKYSKRTSFPVSEPLRAGEGVVIAVTTRGTVAAFSAETGKRLWEHKNTASYTGTKYMDVYIQKGLVWVTGAEDGIAKLDRTGTLAMGLDPQTGELVKSVSSDPVWNTGHHRRCYPGKGTDNFIIYSMRGAEFLNLETGEAFLPPWTRGSCGYGVMPANGLLYSPPHACRCYSETTLRGLTALAPGGQESPVGEPRGEQLEKGPAFGKIQYHDNGTNTGAWSTYRGDVERSGKSDTEVDVSLTKVWKADIGGKLTQPVTADGMVLLASVNTHTVFALDATTGKQRWSYIAGGRIDSPPTLHDGMAMFGAADGHVYCLRASDGELVWRFRAAPDTLSMGAYGQLESVWPVSGSVLVKDGVAYFTAGRSSFLDGGLYAYGLNATTGETLYNHRFDGPHTNKGMEPGDPMPGYVMEGALPDILLTDGDQIYMRQLMLDSSLKKETDMAPNFYPAREFKGQEFGQDHKYWCDLYESGPRAFVGKPEWNFRSYFNQWPGTRLYSTTGLLDDSWHIRSYWSYGQIVGQQIVFDGDLGYAVRAYPNAARWEWFNAGQGYELYAGKTTAPTGKDPVYAIKEEAHLWSTKLDFRPQSMALTNGKLFLCGPPDSADPAEALASLDGKRGGVLAAVARNDGKTLSRIQTDSMPVFDGLIAAEGRIYIAMQDGSVRCFE